MPVTGEKSTKSLAGCVSLNCLSVSNRLIFHVIIFSAINDKNSLMIITTTNNIEGRKISKYLGIVTGEAILGANIFRDMFAAVRDIVGGRSASYERELGKAREIALDELEDWAEELGANAVIGVNLDYESFGKTNGMMMVSATGTAVILEDNA